MDSSVVLEPGTYTAVFTLEFADDSEKCPGASSDDNRFVYESVVE